MFLGKKVFVKSILSAILISFSVLACAASANNQSVAGYWQTIDGKTKKPSSIIQIQQQGQFYEGKVVKTFSVPTEKKISVCAACKGSEKNKPILGLTIIKNMVCQSGSCVKGRILDPRDGKVYHAKMKLVNNGQQLRVHGYVGVPLFGKSVTWNRVSNMK